MKLGILIAALVASLICVITWFTNANNPTTPAGYVGYVTQGAMFGQTRFIRLQTGPTSTGLMWMGYVKNVSVTPYTFTETFEKTQNGDSSILANDNLQVQFQAHILWRVKAEKTKEFIEHYSTLEDADHPQRIVDTAYVNFIKEPLRTFAREEVQKYEGLKIKDNAGFIGEAITAKIQEVVKDTPYEIINVVIGNIQYPDSVSTAVANKIAATQELEQRDTVINMKKKDATIREIEANGIAKAMDIVQQKLTPYYLQHEAIEAQKAMVGSPNHTTIYIPTGNNGVPLVGTIREGDRNDKH